VSAANLIKRCSITFFRSLTKMLKTSLDLIQLLGTLNLKKTKDMNISCLEAGSVSALKCSRLVGKILFPFILFAVVVSLITNLSKLKFMD